MIATKKTCVICLESGRFVKNKCKECNCAHMHNKCFKKVIGYEIFNCPTCRAEIEVHIEKKNKIRINFNNIMRSSSCKAISNNIKIILFLLSLLFLFYLIIGMLACLMKNDFPSIFSERYLDYFLELSLALFIIFVICTSFCAYCQNDEDDLY